MGENNRKIEYLILRVKIIELVSGEYMAGGSAARTDAVWGAH